MFPSRKAGGVEQRDSSASDPIEHSVEPLAQEVPTLRLGRYGGIVRKAE